MQRITHIVTYDICDAKRLREVYAICRGFGEHLQYSVFRCDLTPLARARLVAALSRVIHAQEDQVLFVAVGPTDGAVDDAFEAVGRPYRPRKSRTTIV